MINDFVSQDQRNVLTQYMVIAHIQDIFIKIQNEGMSFGFQPIDEVDENIAAMEEDD